MLCTDFKALVAQRIARIGLVDPVDADIILYMNLGEQDIKNHRPEAFFLRSCSTRRTDYVEGDLVAGSETELNIIDTYVQALVNYVCAYLCLDDAAYTSHDAKFVHLLNAYYRRVNPRMVIPQQRKFEG
ncbi:MAG: hypothetical protein EOM20_10470 [Spartobacteria bacterium]|nr:hypothetical protein [Spartobacteria bacterium]